MKRLMMLVVGIFLAVGATMVLPVDTAGAHDYDGYATIYCEAHKSDTHVEVIHAWPYSLEPGILNYVCTQEDDQVYAGIHQYFVERNMNTGAHRRVGGYQWCGLVNCEPHGVGT